MAMTRKQLKALRRHMAIVHRRNVRRSIPKAFRVPLHTVGTLGRKSPYRLVNI